MQTSKLPNVAATLMTYQRPWTTALAPPTIQGLPGAPLSSAFWKPLSVTFSSLATSLGPQAATIGGWQKGVRSLHLSFVCFLQRNLKVSLIHLLAKTTYVTQVIIEKTTQMRTHLYENYAFEECALRENNNEIKGTSRHVSSLQNNLLYEQFQ